MNETTVNPEVPAATTTPETNAAEGQKLDVVDALFNITPVPDTVPQPSTPEPEQQPVPEPTEAQEPAPENPEPVEMIRAGGKDYEIGTGAGQILPEVAASYTALQKKSSANQSRASHFERDKNDLTALIAEHERNAIGQPAVPSVIPPVSAPPLPAYGIPTPPQSTPTQPQQLGGVDYSSMLKQVDDSISGEGEFAKAMTPLVNALQAENQALRAENTAQKTTFDQAQASMAPMIEQQRRADNRAEIAKYIETHNDGAMKEMVDVDDVAALMLQYEGMGYEPIPAFNHALTHQLKIVESLAKQTRDNDPQEPLPKPASLGPVGKGARPGNPVPAQGPKNLKPAVRSARSLFK